MAGQKLFRGTFGQFRARSIRANLVPMTVAASLASVATCAIVPFGESSPEVAQSPLPPSNDTRVLLASNGPATQPETQAEPDEPSVRLLTFIAARSRVRAERDGLERVAFPDKFQRASTHASRIAMNEQRLFEARRLAFESRQRNLRNKIAVVQDEIAGFNTQRNAKEKEIGLFNEELRAIEKLHTRQLSNISRLMSLRRDLARAQWDVGSIESAVARSHLTIKDIEQQIHENRHSLIVDAEREIRALDLDIMETAKKHPDLDEPLLQLVADAVRPARRR